MDTSAVGGRSNEAGLGFPSWGDPRPGKPGAKAPAAEPARL